MIVAQRCEVKERRRWVWSASNTRDFDVALPKLLNLDGIDVWVLADVFDRDRYEVFDLVFLIVSGSGIQIEIRQDHQDCRDHSLGANSERDP